MAAAWDDGRGLGGAARGLVAVEAVRIPPQRQAADEGGQADAAHGAAVLGAHADQLLRGDAALAPVPGDVIVDAEGERPQQRRLAVVAAPDDQGDAGAYPQAAQPAGVRRPQLDRQGAGNLKGQPFRQRPRVDAAAPRQHAALGEEGDQTALAQLRTQGDLVLHGVDVGPQRLGVEAAGRGEERGAQAPDQQVGGLPAEDAAPRRGQPGAQTDPGAALRIDDDPGPLQDLLAGGADLEQAAPAAAGTPRRPGQRRAQRSLQEVRGGAARVGAAAGPARKPRHLGRYVDAQAARGRERVSLNVIEVNGARSQGVAAAAQAAVLPVRPAVEPDQIAGKGVVAHAGFTV